MTNILFILEGKKEMSITNNLVNHFFNPENVVIQCAYCTTIYKLYNEISKDENLDIFVLLKEMPENKDALKPYKRTDFSQIYLFFDYDGHATNADNTKLEKAISLFDNETEFGKLFISYPMVEALKHYSDNIDFKELSIPLNEQINYKKIVNKECKQELIDMNIYSKDIWINLIVLHLKKKSYIVNGDYSLPTIIASQDEIFTNQLSKYINIDQTIAVLSAFPIFIYDYYGNKFIEELLLKK